MIFYRIKIKRVCVHEFNQYVFSCRCILLNICPYLVSRATLCERSVLYNYPLMIFRKTFPSTCDAHRDKSGNFAFMFLLLHNSDDRRRSRCPDPDPRAARDVTPLPLPLPGGSSHATPAAAAHRRSRQADEGGRQTEAEDAASLLEQDSDRCER